MISSSSVVKIRPDIRYRIVDGEAIVVQQTDARVLNLNPLGTRILTALDGRTPVGELLARLAAEYDVEPEVLAADALRYLDELSAAHVVEPTGPADPASDGL